MQRKWKTFACLVTRKWFRTQRNEKQFKIIVLTNSTLRSLDADKYIPHLRISCQKFQSVWTYGYTQTQFYMLLCTGVKNSLYSGVKIKISGCWKGNDKKNIE